VSLATSAAAEKTAEVPVMPIVSALAVGGGPSGGGICVWPPPVAPHPGMPPGFSYNQFLIGRKLAREQSIAGWDKAVAEVRASNGRLPQKA